ncbi:ribbon-helix-helix domain-containing protein [Candidatus Nanohalobium constans]|uniref:Transcriptional regulator n=1 Tax=Candidatus Nanohalobium constans TaxID=2565781 RepID=A0A5Q0UGL1_9ARCH|nr:ribbon-helix-helix domain-containing protein [Candidatus Nanohalobium constans]QGA80747.1 transcriptional regulator [Candidatus Nanohalobium constans]
MSSVVSFKAPEDMIEELDESVEEGNFTSRGELLRSLVRNMENKKLSEKAKEDIEEARDQEGQPIDEL